MPYEIMHLSSQVKQKIKDKITDSIKSLTKKKSKGFKVGQLKFKSEVNIPLKQFNNTYYLDDDFKYLSIQGSKHSFKLNPHKAIKKLSKELGFGQLSIQGLIDDKIIEIVNAEIIKRLNKSKINCNYKLSLTIYINPEIYDDDKLLIIKHNIKTYLKTNINLFNTNFTNDFDKYHKLRVGKNRIKEANILKEIELKQNLDNKLKLSDRVYKCSCGYENNRDTHGSFNMMLKQDLIKINNQSLKNKVFGRNTSNLVQIITSGVSKDNTENVFDIACIKLESKSYVKLFFNSHISHTRSLVLKAGVLHPELPVLPKKSANQLYMSFV